MSSPLHAAPKSGAGADRLFQLVTAGAAWFVLILLGGAAASMAWGGRLAFEMFGWGFVTSRDWDAVAGKFGALVPIYGTLVTSLLALLIAVPVSIGIGTASATKLCRSIVIKGMEALMVDFTLASQRAGVMPAVRGLARI